MRTITIICGLPGAGKTTYCEQFENVILLTEINKLVSGRKSPYIKCALAALEQEDDIYIEGPFNNIKCRKEFLDVLKDKECKKVCIFINTPFEICLERSDSEKKHAVEYWNNHLEVPTEEEGWDEVIIINE